MSSNSPLHVAIVGGGLCGISLAIALKRRNVSFTLYESRGSFTEIGAGLNLGPNGLQALNAIEPSLRDKIFALATRNPAPEENTWMWLKYGAASGDHEDGADIMKIESPPTGNTTLHRQEFLQALADEMGHEHAKFNKKLATYKNKDDCVVLRFEDGTEETASVVVGCDGIHSRVRASMFGPDNPVSRPHFNQDGAYRAVIPIEKAMEAWGEDAQKAQLTFGPNGYLIYYPVSGGKFVNCGAWYHKGGSWDREDWVLPNQGEQLRKDYRNWGPRVQKLLQYFPENPAFWSAHQHRHQPDHFTDGRVILIGDGAHSMPPHQGGGASQAVEDAFVTAEVIAALQDMTGSGISTDAIHCALKAIEKVRKPRFIEVQGFSTLAGTMWYSFYEQKLEGEKLEEWKRTVMGRLQKIWDIEIEKEAEKAKQLMVEMLDKPASNGRL